MVASDLPVLPRAPRFDVPEATAADRQELEDWLAPLCSPNPDQRLAAAQALLEVRARHFPAIHERFERLSETADKPALKRTLSRLREQSVAESSNSQPLAGASEQAGDKDLLRRVVETGDTKNPLPCQLAQLLGMSRMLQQIGNIEATRELVQFYVRFGEFLRIDTQNRLLELGDRAVAALIEARRHPSEKVARWAARQLDRLGKAIPSEAIRTNDYEVLADVLRAFGRSKDVDAARLVVTFANSERHQVREAARQAIGLLGESCIWQLRDTYEQVVGRKPRRDWSWERTARELFAEYDRLRLARVHVLFEQGLAARTRQDWSAMRENYDRVLTRDPKFEKSSIMAEGYAAMARALQSSDPATSMLAVVRVERLSDDPALRRQAKSLRLALTAQRLSSQGVVDSLVARSALELDSNNRLARSVLGDVDRELLERDSLIHRLWACGTIGGLAVLAILVLLLRRRTPLELPTEASADSSTEPQDAPDRQTGALGAPEPTSPDRQQPEPQPTPQSELDRI